MIMIPFFVVFMLLHTPVWYLVALAVFCVASITDLLDGKIARKYNMVTNFGWIPWLISCWFVQP